MPPDSDIRSFERERVPDGPRLGGLVTLLFTDVVGSTEIKQRLGDRDGVELVQQHHQLLRDTLRQVPEAEEISAAGDSFLLLFPAPSDAVRFALILQAGLREFNLHRSVPVRDRIGLHMGEVVVAEKAAGGRDVHGIQVDTCARVMSLAHGGQILMTRSVFDNARQSLRGEALRGAGSLSWLNHGPFELKGFEEPVEICEVRDAESASLEPPTTSEKARRVEAAEGKAVTGWRPAVRQMVPGTQWALEQKLGEGAFGEVWLGRHLTLRERRVFKFCFRLDRVRMLKREMALFCLIQGRMGGHPNIVSLRDVSFDEPPFYVEEEYVAGRDLESWCVAQGGVENVPLETKLEIVAQIADGLQAAHDAGVIHRDVKPGNILVTRSSRREALTSSQQPQVKQSEPHVGCYDVLAKLTDFGIGQVVSEEALQGAKRAGFTQTLLGSTSSASGTQLYIAPELLAGKPASTRSDLYSLGVVLYQLLVEDFTRPVVADWAEQISEPLLREDLKRCLAGEPQARFAAAGQLAQQLRGLPGRREELERREAEKGAIERAAYRRGVVRASGLATAVITVIVALAVVALRQSQRAAAEAGRARQAAAAERHERGRYQHQLYIANMNLVQQAWEQNKAGLVRQMLDEVAVYPGRSFEWYYWQRQTHLELMTLSGHLGSVESVSFSPDGQRIATGGDDGTVRVWEAASGKELMVLRGHLALVHAVTFSIDGARIASGSDDETVRLWDARSGTNVLTIKAHSDHVTSVAFSPDGLRLLTGSEDRTAKVLDAATGAELATLKGHSAPVRSVAFSPDGRLIVTGSDDRTARLWDVSGGSELAVLVGHSAGVSSVAFSPDSQRIVTGSTDRTARLWEVSGRRALFILKGHQGEVRSAAFSADGRRIVTGGADQAARVWDAADGKELMSLRGHDGEVRCAAISPDGSRIVTGGSDQKAKVWDASGNREFLSLIGHTGEVKSVAISADGRRIVTGGADKTVRVWEAASGRELLTLRADDADFWSVAFSPDGQRIAAGDSANTCTVWEAAGGGRRFAITNQPGPIRAVVFSPDGRRLLTAGSDSAARLWDFDTGKEVLAFTGHTAPIRSAAFSPDGRLIVTAGLDETARVWDAASGREQAVFRGHTAEIRSVAFSPDGTRLVTGSLDRTARVWDVARQKVVLILRGHGAPIWSVTFSPDGRRVVTAGTDQTAKLWDAATGKEMLTLKGHRSRVFSVAFSQDGQRIVTGSMDHTARVWDAASSDQVANWAREEQAGAQYLALQRSELAAAAEHARALRAADPGALKQWLVLLPIAYEGQNGAQAVQMEQVAREDGLRPRAGQRVAIGERELAWREVSLEDYLLNIDLLLGARRDWIVAYAVTYILSETDRVGVALRIGSDDQAKVYLNGAQVYERLAPRAYIADQDAVHGLKLRAGVNVLVLKLVNEMAECQASVWLTDAAGQPLKGIQVTLTPP